MINTVILYSTESVCKNLKANLNEFFPDVNIAHLQSIRGDILDTIERHNPQLVFFEPDMPNYNYNVLCKKLSNAGCELILILEKSRSKITHFESCVSGLLYKPMNRANFIVSVRTVINKIKILTSLPSLAKSDVSLTRNFVGIPTFEGVEYLNTENIIRCEGIQKCSRVITEDRKDIISSYSIGNFAELLIPFGFELVHRSHLINLQKVKRYTREGYIHLSNDSRVPLARRKKTEFLNLWAHL